MIKKWAEDLNRHFPKKCTDGQQTHEKMLNITNHQRNANQMTMAYHPIPVRMAIIKKTIITSIVEDVKKRNAHALLVGM